MTCCKECWFAKNAVVGCIDNVCKCHKEQLKPHIYRATRELPLSAGCVQCGEPYEADVHAYDETVSTPATSWEEKFFEVCVGDLRTSKETRLLVLDFIRKEIERVGKEQYLQGRQDILEEIGRMLPPARTENYFEAKGMNHYRTAVLTLLDSLKKKV